jgi:hypothetical protein
MSEKKTWGITPGRRFVQPRRTPDENAQAAWDQVLDVLQMLDGMVKDGAKIRLSRMIASPSVDVRQYMVQALAAKVGRILANAKISDT